MTQERNMKVELSVTTTNADGKVTVTAWVRDNLADRWYRSEVDIVEPITTADLPAALRLLSDELERNLNSQR